MDKIELNELNNRYEEACNDILQAFSKTYDVQVDAQDWVAGQTGTVACVNEEFYINMDDILFMLNNDVEWNTFLAWWDYCLDCSMLGLNDINLQSWCKGAPRYSQESIDRLKSMRKDLDDEIARMNHNKF